MKKGYLLIVIFFSISLHSYAGDIPSAIISAFGTGNSTAISSYFGQTVELTLFDQEEIYSKTQAQIILKNFFNENAPVSFKIIHQGGKESSKYAIGSLKTSNKSYRITLLLKSNGSDINIHQLRIENEYAE